jgi:hypothetical protein
VPQWLGSELAKWLKFLFFPLALFACSNENEGLLGPFFEFPIELNTWLPLIDAQKRRKKPAASQQLWPVKGSSILQ